VWSESSKAYITKSYNSARRESRVRAISLAEFLLAVRGEVWLELSKNLGEQATRERAARLLMEFDRRLDAGMAKDREAKAKDREAKAEAREPRAEGEEPDAFTNPPERIILKRAIQTVVVSDTPRPRKRKKYAGDFTANVDKKAHVRRGSAGAARLPGDFTAIFDKKAHKPSKIAELAERALCVQEALGRLDEKDQKILMLHFYDQQSQVNIAERLDMPPQTVNGRLHRALGKLRFALQGHADR
jgi:RNA polymerase sigma factor (sigma-70 family)